MSLLGRAEESFKWVERLGSCVGAFPTQGNVHINKHIIWSASNMPNMLPNQSRQKSLHKRIISFTAKAVQKDPPAADTSTVACYTQHTPTMYTYITTHMIPSTPATKRSVTVPASPDLELVRPRHMLHTSSNRSTKEAVLLLASALEGYSGAADASSCTASLALRALLPVLPANTVPVTRTFALLVGRAGAGARAPSYAHEPVLLLPSLTLLQTRQSFKLSTEKP
jgi:hypothetical protein